MVQTPPAASPPTPDFQSCLRRAEALPLPEVLALLSGRDYWHTQAAGGARALRMTDGPHGIRRQLGDQSRSDLNNSAPATCYPTASALAASWNPVLVGAVGEMLGREARAEGVDVLLGPGLNLKRSPLCGRNFEYFSEDPLLSGDLAAAWVSSIQSQGVGASLKHFVANNQEYRRMSIDAVVDERALRELYLAGFEKAVRGARPWTVMAAYNGVNGRYCCESPRLLQGILRREWGYDGLVVSDWGAVSDRAAAFHSGLDLEMPGVPALTAPALEVALREGRVQEAELRRAAARVLQLAARADTAQAQAAEQPFDPEVAHALAREAAVQGSVLLKNDPLDGTPLLPLRPDTGRLAVLGAFAAQPRYQGAGSSQLVPRRLDIPLDALREAFGAAQVTYSAGYPRAGDQSDPQLLAEAAQAAAQADVVVAFVGLPEAFEVEGIDRQHLGLPASHNALIEELLVSNPRLVVVVQGGAPVELPWAERVPAILNAYLGGQAGGSAVAALLSGAANPSGRLAESWAAQLEHWPSSDQYPGGPRTVEYRESLLLGYRYFDRPEVQAPVPFPFGHGLSYTQFRYSDARPAADGRSVTLTVTNVGSRAGAEVVQLYLHRPQETSAVLRPGQALAAYARAELAPGESQDVTLTLPARAFAHYDPFWGRWRTEAGEWQVRIGASSRDIRVQYRVQVAGETLRYEQEPGGGTLPASYRRLSFPLRVSRSDFQALYGRPLPDNRDYRTGSYTANTPLDAMQEHPLASGLFRVLVWHQRDLVGDTGASMNSAHNLRQLPLRAMNMNPGLTANPPLARFLAEVINRHYGPALRELRLALRRSWHKRRH
ncbi:glycoside hydrolase family 3 C-terminal domain-containing protein [Deinococcus sp. SL84]|uniref:glycoside hydrolase family 3 C-terminal domain-containing protein n=1 Tax=Deinococcus sp. SL84 TaxID=2994663 RepID=UPI002272B014|nr:glycoside hydrolase family 3 C-terminal domain-containing protein [Deinococcus sp. SL84]MCY1704026.1 glycoside hydrolase family 3 C-terminal domain-containing protein [Deinococcus sp. SL84]